MTDGWSGLDQAEVVEGDDAKILRREAARALDTCPALRKYLHRNLQAASFAPSRSAEDVAFREGQRMMAHTLLQLGGHLDAEQKESE